MLSPGAIHSFGGFGRNGVSLLMEAMLLNRLDTDRLERAQSYVQGEFSDLDPPLAETRKNVRGEVQSGGGCSHRAALAGVDGLIAFLVGRPVLAGDIGRKRYVTESFDDLKEILNRSESNTSFAEGATGQDLRLKLWTVPEIDLLAHTDFATRTHQAIPVVGTRTDLPGKKNFHRSLQEVAGRRIVGTERLGAVSRASSVESRRKNSGVIENEQIVGSKNLGELPESSVPDAPCAPIEPQHERSGTFRQRLLCNLLFGKIVVKVGDEHWAEL
jgi:hypothetical protein